MITRKTARLVADACVAVFSTENFYLNFQELADFIYDEGYEPWFWNVFQTSNSRDLVRQRVMNLHTGNTFQWFNVVVVDPEKAGQEYLLRLAASILRFFEENPKELRHAEQQVQSLRAHLELDGYIYVKGE